MKTNLLDSKVQLYIQQHVNTSISSLAFKKSPFEGIEMSELLTQIESKQKSKDKLPTWYITANILFPKKLSIEQTSSEECAKYKASLVQGNNLIDLTGGFGIDCYYFAQNVKHVLHCEMQEELSQIVKHNYEVLQCNNISCHTGNSITFLENNTDMWDYIYVDPHRRNDAKEKVFFLKDCLPNIPNHLDLLLERSRTVIIKTSPLLDLHAGINELNHVKEIHIVALNNEVKELLWIIEKDYDEEVNLIAVNITKQHTHLFKTALNKISLPNYMLPQTYLYEPNSAVLKTGKFDEVSKQYNLGKLHQHSQLYTSDKQIDFAGRCFKIDQIIPYNKQEAKAYLTNLKANVTVRNFPIKVEEIRKKWKMKEGGDIYLFFTTNIHNERIIIVCSKIAVPN